MQHSVVATNRDCTPGSELGGPERGKNLSDGSSFQDAAEEHRRVMYFEFICTVGSQISVSQRLGLL